MRWGGGSWLAWLPFFGFVLLSPPSLSSFSSRSVQRRTCSWRIFRNRVFFWSSLRASSTSGSMYMSFRICCSMLAAEWPGWVVVVGGVITWVPPGRAGHRGGEALSFGRQLLEGGRRLVFIASCRWEDFRRFFPWITLVYTHKLFLVKQGRMLIHASTCTYCTVTHTHTQSKSCFLSVLCWQLVRPAEMSLYFVFGGHLWDNLQGEKKKKHRPLQTGIWRIMLCSSDFTFSLKVAVSHIFLNPTRHAEKLFSSLESLRQPSILSLPSRIRKSPNPVP